VAALAGGGEGRLVSVVGSWGCVGGGEGASDTLHQPSLHVEFEAEADEQAG